MRLGRLAAAGLMAGAIMAFAIALLLPRRRAVVDPLADLPDLTDLPDLPDLTDGSVAAPRARQARQVRQVDVAGAERATLDPATTSALNSAEESVRTR